MVARTVLGEKGSAQWLTNMSPAAPKASAVRQMVPTFPGSCTPSSTSHRPAGRRSGGAVGGRAHRASTPWGLSVSDRLFKRSSGTSASRTPGRGGSPSSPLGVASTVRISAPQRTASPRSLGPSMRNSPASRRAARARLSLRMRMHRAF